MHTPSVPIHFVNAALDPLRSRNDMIERLLDQNHIPPNLLNRPCARVPAEDFSNLLRDAMVASGDEQLGHGVARQPLGSWATMAQLSISADNLGEALRRLARFYRLVPWGIRTRLEISEHQSVFVMEKEAEHPFSAYIFESFLFYVYRFSNWLIDKQIPLVSVGFCFPAPPQRPEYRRMFLTSRFHFDQPNGHFIFLSHYLKEPIRQDQYSLKKFLEHTNLAMVAQTCQHQNWHTGVQHYLVNRLAMNPGIREVAAALGVHPHTLRSQLLKEGVYFQDIKNQLRCEIAIDFLCQGYLSIEEISDRLGFSEISAFSRAFKIWMGMSPLAYQRYGAGK